MWLTSFGNMRWFVAIAMTIGLLFSAGKGHADSPTHLLCNFSNKNNYIVADFTVVSAFSDTFKRRILGGLTSTVQINIRVVSSEGQTLDHARRYCEIAYDLWTEEYTVSIEDHHREKKIASTHHLLDDALEICGHPKDLPVLGPKFTKPRRNFIMETMLILNPVSEELIKRSRQFVTNPHGGARSRSRSVLEAVANLFRARSGGALGETIEFQTPFSTPSPNHATKVNQESKTQ